MLFVKILPTSTEYIADNGRRWNETTEARVGYKRHTGSDPSQVNCVIFLVSFCSFSTGVIATSADQLIWHFDNDSELSALDGMATMHFPEIGP